VARREPEQQIEEWRQRLVTTGRVEIGIDRTRSLILIAVAAAFVAGGVALVASGDWVGWPCIGIAGLGGSVFVGRLVGPGVIIDRGSIRYARWHVDVPWEELDHARCWAFRNNKIVQLTVSPEFHKAHDAGRPPILRLLIALDRRFIGPSINLPTPLAADGEALAEWLTAEADARR